MRARKGSLCTKLVKRAWLTRVMRSFSASAHAMRSRTTGVSVRYRNCDVRVGDGMQADEIFLAEDLHEVAAAGAQLAVNPDFARENQRHVGNRLIEVMQRLPCLGGVWRKRGDYGALVRRRQLAEERRAEQGALPGLRTGADRRVLEPAAVPKPQGIAAGDEPGTRGRGGRFRTRDRRGPAGGGSRRWRRSARVRAFPRK